jgi:HAD superfamily hydrolase (TIGR01509 family)
MIRNIIFDLDGVLFDGLAFHRKNYLDALLTVKIECPIDDDYFVKNLEGMSSKSRTEFLVSKGYLTEFEGNMVCQLKQLLTMERLDSYKFDGEKVKVLLLILKSLGFELYCVSNSVRDTQVKVLKGLGILNMFDGLVSSDDVVKPKPDPEPYLLCFQRYGLLPDECLIIEDSEVGLKAARASAARVMAVDGPEEVTLENISNNVNRSVR